MRLKRKQTREDRRERMERDLSRYGRKILESHEMTQAYHQRHHKLSNVGEHTMRVARTSLGICYALRKLNVKTDIPAVVTGSLCHDLGILGRREKFASDRVCSRQHPVDSVETAQRLAGPLPEKTEDIISRHMWPFGGSKPPNSLEAAVVSTADKIATVGDYVQALRRKIRKSDQ